jgi:hypothetical protein
LRDYLKAGEIPQKQGKRPDGSVWAKLAFYIFEAGNREGVLQMKKNTCFVAGMLAVMLVFGLAVVGCDNGTTSSSNNGNNSSDNGNNGGGDDDVTGNWGGTVNGEYVSVTIASGSWTLSTTGFSDYGTYTMNGTTASLRSNKYNVATGTAVLVNGNTIRVTLNSNSIAPGTYTLTRQ